MSDETKTCNASEPSAYSPDDVTTWSAQEFEQKAAIKLRSYWSKIESIKNLLKDGKQVIAYEQIQGLSDGIGFLVKLFDDRNTDKLTDSH